MQIYAYFFIFQKKVAFFVKILTESHYRTLFTISFKNATGDVDAHFVDVSKMVKAGVAPKEIDDVQHFSYFISSRGAGSDVRPLFLSNFRFKALLFER